MNYCYWKLDYPVMEIPCYSWQSTSCDMRQSITRLQYCNRYPFTARIASEIFALHLITYHTCSNLNATWTLQRLAYSCDKSYYHDHYKTGNHCKSSAKPWNVNQLHCSRRIQANLELSLCSFSFTHSLCETLTKLKQLVTAYHLRWFWYLLFHEATSVTK